jgi:hypothetical protein
MSWIVKRKASYQPLSRAGVLVRVLADRESQPGVYGLAPGHERNVLGFSQGPKAQGAVVTLHFERSISRAYTEEELLEANGIIFKRMRDRNGREA